MVGLLDFLFCYQGKSYIINKTQSNKWRQNMFTVALFKKVNVLNKFKFINNIPIMNWLHTCNQTCLVLLQEQMEINILLVLRDRA